MLEPLRAEDPAFVLEFKVRDPEDEGTLADTAAAALPQVEDSLAVSPVFVPSLLPLYS